MSGDRRKVVVHIGTEKCGSTAFQTALTRKRHDLAKQGWYVLQDSLGNKSQSWDLAVACLRPSLDAPFRYLRPSTMVPSMKEQAIESVQVQSSLTDKSIIASMENLSMMRSVAEVDALSDLFPDRQLEVVIVTRDKMDYLRRYRQTLHSLGIPTTTSGPKDSATYVASDSWLLNWEVLIDLLVQHPKVAEVHHLEYETGDGYPKDVIPRIAAVAGMPQDLTNDLESWKKEPALLEPANLEPQFDARCVEWRRVATVCQSSRLHRLAARLQDVFA